MHLSQALLGVKIIEAIENYSIADNNKLNSNIEDEPNNNFEYYEDKAFWNAVCKRSQVIHNSKITLNSFVVSEWVARIPGLYWQDYSILIRQSAENQIAITSQEWTEFYPPGKSMKVIGGIGTILLPPNDEGKRIMSVSSSCNASLGIPILVYPDVYDAIKLSEGDEVRIIDAQWKPINHSWASRFASTKDIPRGYLVIDSINKIRVFQRDIPITHQPFTIMEYQNRDALLYDFVYLSIDSKVKNLKYETERFFNYYSRKENRNGRYLLNPNLVDPIFEAYYMSPQEMRQVSEIAQLELLQRRIKDSNFGLTTLNELVLILPSYYNSPDTLRSLARRVGLSVSLFQIDTAASMSIQIINHCIKTNKIIELIDRMQVEYPDIFNQ